VRNHITHPPARTQCRHLPLLRRQRREKRREIRPFLLRQTPHVHNGQASQRVQYTRNPAGWADRQTQGV